MVNELQNKKYEYARQLVYERFAIPQPSHTIKDLSEQTKPPSGLKYFFLFIVALIGDIIDILGSLTGIGTIVSFLADFIISPIIYMGSKGAYSRIQENQGIAETINNQIENISRKINQIRKSYIAAYRVSKRLGLRKTTSFIRTTSLRLKRITLGVMKNPKVKTGIAIIADFIPFLDIFPFRSISVISTYRDEKNTYQQITESIKEALQAEKEYNKEIKILQMELSA